MTTTADRPSTGSKGTGAANGTVKRPQDRKPKKPSAARIAQQVEALDEPVTFKFDGEEWTITPSDVTGLEFLDVLADVENDPTQIPRAMRILLGDEQGSRFIRGRKAADVDRFFDELGAQVDSGNP